MSQLVAVVTGARPSSAIRKVLIAFKLFWDASAPRRSGTTCQIPISPFQSLVQRTCYTEEGGSYAYNDRTQLQTPRQLRWRLRQLVSHVIKSRPAINAGRLAGRKVVPVSSQLDRVRVGIG